MQNSQAMSLGERRLAEGAMLPLFVRFAVPGIMSLLFFGIQILINGALIGNFVGADALASMNLILPVFGLTVSFCIVLNVGAQCIVGLRLGERDYAGANGAFFSGFVLTLAATLSWAVFSYFFSVEISRFMGADEKLLSDCSVYLKISAISMPMTSLVFYLSGAFRAQGRPMFSFFIMVLMVVVHLISDLFFIVYLKMGLVGAAYATIFGGAAGLLFSLPTFFKRVSTLSLFKGGFSLKTSLMMLYNGSSEGMSELTVNLMIIIFNYVMMKSLGSAGVAAFTAVNYLSFVAAAFFIGLTDGMRSIISYNYGMKNSERVFGALKLAAAVVGLLGIAFWAFIFLFNDFAISLFFSDKEAEVIALAKGGAKIFSFAFLMQGLNILASAYFTAIGNAKISLVIAFLKGFAFTVIAVFALQYFFGVDGIWAAVPAGEFMTLFVSFALMFKALSSLKKGDFKQYA